MRKQELVHLHGLLAEVRRYCEQEDSRSLDLSKYESLGTDEAAIHRGKEQHRSAVFALAEALTEGSEEKQTVVTTTD
ncbi:conserved hypothetical protein [Halorhabdus utahensis DSM 12940]|uniref:Metal-binding protein n=1 Tax=Halorhabdus utahensis (strain DSM 12940 / JCM 11049 / AX-2) TaxID=519442 RepID=C7NS40_HALUD|nr:UPF0058 family protein [Halorhabdus utahensis]ACV10647.1 conserved hypothetical protein [Halorhabdus utahensis DSM 12940]